jgi:hypothetical protein
MNIAKNGIIADFPVKLYPAVHVIASTPFCALLHPRLNPATCDMRGRNLLDPLLWSYA